MSAMSEIHLFRPYYRTKEVLEEIEGCLEIGWTGLGFKTVEFEEAWLKYSGLKNAYYLNSSTSGLFMAFRILKEEYGWDNNAEVITTPLTFVSTNHAILSAGLRPRFADIDQSLNLDPQSVLSRINTETRAVVFVGIGGNLDNYIEVARICRDNNLVFILDAAHMVGSKIGGNQVGVEADVSVFSFQAVKNLPTSDSGMVCFKSDVLAGIARKYGWLGIDLDTYSRTKSERKYKWKYDVSILGNKYHGNSIAACLGLVGLKYLDSDNKIRRGIASSYREMLVNCATVEFIEHNIRIEDAISSRHLVQILLNGSDRDSFIDYLNNLDIYPGVHYVSNQKYDLYKCNDDKCPVSDDISERIVSLPCHLYLQEKDIEYIARVVSEYGT